MIRLEHIEKGFKPGTPDENRLFTDFNLTVADGSFVSVVGSNGSGKTTTLNLISGTLLPDGGHIYANETDITGWSEHKRARRIGRVFQDPQKGTCADLTILENMALADNKGRAYSLGRAINPRRREYYQELLSRCHMGLEGRLGVAVGSLSGGQRQALALVIATMNDIDLLLLDEHTAALDPRSSETVMELTGRLVAEKGVTTLMVTHNLRFAVEYGDRLLMMHQGQAVLDLAGDAKRQATVDQLLEQFNTISIECGN